MTDLIIKCSKMILSIPEKDLVAALIRTGKFDQALERGKAYMIRGQTIRKREKEMKTIGIENQQVD